MNPMPLLKNKFVIVVIVALFLLVILAPMARPATLFSNWNTTGETKTIKFDLWSLTYGINFDTEDIIGSWESNMNSERFVLTGKIKLNEKSFEWPFAMSAKYVLFVEGGSTPIKESPWYDVPAFTEREAWYYLQPWTDITVKTTGNVMLKAYIILYSTANKDDIDTKTHDYSDAAWDGAMVNSGRGDIYLPANQLGPFEEGQNVNIYVKTGYTGGAGWYVKMYPPADRTDLDQTGTVIKRLSDGIKGTYISWTVPDGAYKLYAPGEYIPPDANAWRAVLWNNYFEVGFDEVLTIDRLDRAPIITNVQDTNNGDSFTYTVSVEQTYAELSHVIVYAWYGYGGTTMPSTSDTASWVIYAEQYTITGGVATFTVTPKNQQGDIVVKTVAYDVEGRPSTPDYKAFSVDYEGGTDPAPSPLEQPFVWTTLAVIIAVMIALASIAILFLAPSPWEIKIVLVIVLGVVGAILVWLAGTLQLGGI